MKTAIWPGLVLFLGCVSTAPPVAAQSVELISRDPSGAVPANPYAHAYRAMVSANGRYVLFTTFPLEFTRCGHWFLRDRWLGSTELISRNAAGEPAVCLLPTPGQSTLDFAAISADGRYIAFVSRAINLVPGEVTGRFRSYRFDRALNQMRLVLADRPGLSGDVMSDMDDSGQRVVVEFGIGNASTNHLAVVDVGAGEQSIQAIGCDFYTARISGDGRRITCRGITVVPPTPSPRVWQIVMLDLPSAIASTVSLDDNGQPAPNEAIRDRSNPAINFDGSVIAYEQWNFSNPALPWGPQTWVRLVNENRRVLVSRNNAGQPGDTVWAGFYAAQNEPALSADGTRIAFRSNAANFPGGDAAAPNYFPQVYVFDRVRNVLTLASRDIHGQGARTGSSFTLCETFVPVICGGIDHVAWSPAISGDGRIVAFHSSGPDLIPNDPLQRLSVYAYDLGSTTQGTPSAMAVPAGNWKVWLVLALLLASLGPLALRRRCDYRLPHPGRRSGINSLTA